MQDVNRGGNPETLDAWAEKDGIIRELQETVEMGVRAISNIGLSELRLMNKSVKDDLAAFIQAAHPVFEALILARYADKAAEVYDQVPDVAGADEGEPEECGLIDGPMGTPIDPQTHEWETADAQAPEPANERDEQMVVDNANKAADGLGMGKMSAVEEESLRRQYRRSGKPEDTDQAMGQALDEYNQTLPDADAEPVMCPQTKDGIRCSRELHNVGLHTPDGYPALPSWTDKESD